MLGAATPLPSLLSWALIAYTIELDNEFEHRMAAGRYRGFRVSLSLWENFLRLIGPGGVTVGELPTLAGISPRILHMYLAMERWGFVTVDPDREHRPPGRPRREWVVRKTAVGETAGAVWMGLDEVIEQRWIDRFGVAAVSDLRGSLEAIAVDLGVDRPRFLPMMSFADGMRTHAPSVEDRRSTWSSDPVARLSLAALLSLVLLEFTLDFERGSDLSLALSANVLRALGDGRWQLRDLPGLIGVPRETVRASVGFLARRGYVTIETDLSGRTKTAHLTSRGRQAHRAHGQILEEVRAKGETRFGRANIEQLDHSLRRVLEERDGARYRLSEGLVPYPEGWRASPPYRTHTDAMIADPMKALPHCPLVTHRGGWPDGS